MNSHSRSRDLPGRPAPLPPARLGLRAVQASPTTKLDSRFTNHQSQFTLYSPLVVRHCRFLIGSRPLLEFKLTRSQQTRKLLLIATFSAISAPAPRLANHDPRIGPPFLFDTNKPHKIIILTRTPLKTKEKRFSIRYKLAPRGTGLPPRRACPPGRAIL